MKVTPDQILNAVQLHKGRITAKVIKGSQNRKVNTHLPNWLFKTDVNYTLLGVISPVEGYNEPFVVVMGFRTDWGVN